MATAAMPSSRHARMTRMAISPRLAIRTVRNMPLLGVGGGRWALGSDAVATRGVGPSPDSLPSAYRLPPTATCQPGDVRPGGADARQARGRLSLAGEPAGDGPGAGGRGWARLRGLPLREIG